MSSVPACWIPQDLFQVLILCFLMLSKYPPSPFSDIIKSYLDLGFDIFLDADPWVNATITAPDGAIFEVDTGQGLNEKGNTEIQTESAEPPSQKNFVKIRMIVLR